MPRAFFRLAIGQAISLAGDSFRILTMMLWVYAASGNSPRFLGIVLLAQYLPQILLGPLGGAILDRVDKIKAIIAGDLTRFVLGCLLVLTVLAGNIFLALTVAAVSSGVAALAQPAVRSAIHTIVPGSSLTRANSIYKIFEQTAFLAGPAAAVLCYSRFGPVATIAIDALSFLVSAMAVAGLSAPAVAKSGEAKSHKRLLLSETVDGVRYLARHNVLRRMLFVYSCVGVLAGAAETITIDFLSRDLHIAPTWVGAVTVGNGLMQVAIGGVIIARASKLQVGTMLSVATAVMASGAVCVALAQNLPMLMAAMMLVAMGNMPYGVASVSIQQSVPDGAFRGRIIGLFEGIGGAAFLLAAQLAAVVADLRTPRLVFAITGAVMAMGAIAAFPLRHRIQPAAGSDSSPAPAAADQIS